MALVMKYILVWYRVAPRLTENRVPGGEYPEPSEPESSRSNSRNRAYFYSGYPGTHILFYTEPPRLGYPLINTYPNPNPIELLKGVAS